MGRVVRAGREPGSKYHTKYRLQVADMMSHGMILMPAGGKQHEVTGICNGQQRKADCPGDSRRSDSQVDQSGDALCRVVPVGAVSNRESFIVLRHVT